MTEKRSTAAVMARHIREAGVPYIFCYPGDPIIEFMEVARQSGLEVVLARREGTAAFMAEAYAMATGQPGICLSTLGPGSTALVNGVACATLDRVPMVAISGQISAAREQVLTHQVVDHKMLFGPVTKWAGRVEAAAVATTMRKAWRTAMAERPGAVHLTCDGDTFKTIASDSDVAMPPLGPDVTTIQVQRTPDSTADPRDMLAAARRPVLIAGIGATRSGATASLVDLAESAGIPVIVAPMAKGVFPEDHPYFAGVIDMACNQVVWEFLDSADLIVTAGFDAVELIKPWPLTQPVLHIDAIANVDQIYASDCEMIGDIGATLGWLADGWTGGQRWPEDDVAAHRSRLRRAYYAGRVAGRLNPTDVVDTVRAATSRDTVVTSDVGSHKLLVGQGWEAYSPRRVLMTNGLSAMGLGVPAAIAGKLVHGEAPVVAMVGDGGFAMSATEMRLAAGLELAIAVVVFVDGSLNRIELKQLAQHYPSTGTRLETSDLVGLANAMECDGVRVDTPAELEKAVADVNALERPLVIEARIDPSQYESQF